jgi:TPR repeat protein
MTTREIGFGLYDVRRPATSPTRKGAAKGRPPPRGLNQHTTTPRPALTPSLPRPLVAAPAHPRSSADETACAAAQCTTTAPAAVQNMEPTTTATHASTKMSGTRTRGAASSAPTVHTTLASSSEPHLSPIPHAASTSGALSYLENHFRCVTHLTTTPVLLPSFLEILHGVLRLLQHDRAQQKGQQPCRRHPSLSGSDAEAEVTHCLTQAAQASSLTAAADILERFLRTHGDAATAAAVSPPLTSSPATMCSPVVLVGATLAELRFSGRVASCGVEPSVLLAYLDAAVAAGHPGAMTCVGVCLRDGRGGVAMNVKAGLAWLRCAAATGYVPAMHELGEAYEGGVGHVTAAATASSSSPSLPSPLSDTKECGADWGEAMRWYRRAAEAGYAPSQLNLGKLLLLAAEQGGQDGTADPSAVDHLHTEARRWLQACAAAGVEEGVRLLRHVK